MFTVTEKWKPEDPLVLGVFTDEGQTSLIKQLKESAGLHTPEYLEGGLARLSQGRVESLILPYENQMVRVICIGLGARSMAGRAESRKVWGQAFQQIQAQGIERCTLFLDTLIPDDEKYKEWITLLGETIYLSTYKLENYKTAPVEEQRLKSIQLFSDSFDAVSVEEAFTEGTAYAEGANTARKLVHLPANILTASELAAHALKMAGRFGFDARILEKQDMEELGMGALLAVNQGSVEPPKLIVLKYQGLEEWRDVTALVGKGITYDTGGYSIKSKAGMPGMKGDMGGAAAVLGAMETIGRIKPEKNVLAVIPSTDNMIAGGAFKPDDVLTSMSGQTIEVLNTDAEGRLALADAVTYARTEGADRVIDVATLTGGVVTALGSWMTGAMTNDASFYKQIENAGRETGEPIWLLPYNEDYKAQVRKSSIADLNNSPTRKAHAIMGGAFVGAFAEGVPWVHLDIAGTSTAETAHALGPKGPTGVMARTLAYYVNQ
ncbi:leucyl aminopeptidase [Halobacillus litoralis]|uniref:leucyl aminopeptidase n=1 Tax=Halobacillus litoralis TaxID=45668 RepID=UPI00136A9BF5|nr:leucyl aminopeptidase [Halobacillus litoralis]MYL38518.1 leucyl aminopeptidase [Halobacillus litoralis]